jgi:hypothetical protein
MRRDLRAEADTLNLRFVVVHGDRLAKEDLQDADRFLVDILGGRMVAEDGPHRLYRLPAEDAIAEQ